MEAFFWSSLYDAFPSHLYWSFRMSIEKLETSSRKEPRYFFYLSNLTRILHGCLKVLFKSDSNHSSHILFIIGSQLITLPSSTHPPVPTTHSEWQQLFPRTSLFCSKQNKYCHPLSFGKSSSETFKVFTMEKLRL